MRVAFFGQTGPYAPPALRVLLAEPGPFEIVVIVEGRKAPPTSRGPHHYNKPKAGPLPKDIEDLVGLGVASGIPVFQTNDVNAPSAVRFFEEQELDLILCVGFDRLFSKAVLGTARRGGINAHPSRLPELRGPSPIFWALKQGKRELAVTLHGLDPREDHGPIYAQNEFVLPRRATGEVIYEVAGSLAGSMLSRLLREVSNAPLRGTPQEHGRATRAPRPKPEDALVDPSEWNAETLVDFCIGATFFRTPWMRLGDDAFFVRTGLDVELGRRLPGHYFVQRDRLVVQCKDGLAHLQIQTVYDDGP